MNRQSPFHDTIFALSSGHLPSGVAVIRLSGPHVADAVIDIAGALPPPRRAVLRHIRGVDGMIDRGLVLFFPGSASFTGEDCAEFHLHGGRAVVLAMLSALGQRPGCRQAEAGEFTRRSFINGKIDLTGAEGLADLIAADTEAQRQLALRNAEGGQQELYDGWRSRLLRARAMVEAELDFADEGDVPGSISGQAWADMDQLCEEIETHLAGFRHAEIVREGFRVVLVGAPNAGKSSLLNALAKRELAIVTDVPGTTRDLIETTLDLNGLKVLVTDTAGVRETNDSVERMGVERALAAARRADLVIELVEPGAKPVPGLCDTVPIPRLQVASKCDLPQSHNELDHSISAKTGKGVDKLLDEIEARARAATNLSGNVVPTRIRHVELLRATKENVSKALQLEMLELRAEQLRLASDFLGKITGTLDVEELLGTIFSQFCIGK